MAKLTQTKWVPHTFVCDPQTHQVIQCPGGYRPLNAIYKKESGVHLVKFAKPDCGNCPLRTTCPVQEGKDTYRLRFTENKRTADEMRAQIHSNQHRELANFRAGVEGVPSVLRRAYRIDQMPIRGFMRSKMWIMWFNATVGLPLTTCQLILLPI